MADNSKRTEVVSFKATERMALDLLRLASSQDRSLSEFLFGLVHTHLYGSIVRLDAIAAQSTSADNVDPPQRRRANDPGYR